MGSKSKRDQWTEYLRRTGRPQTLDRPHVEEVREHLVQLHARGMAIPSMARHAGVSLSTAQQLYQGSRVIGGPPIETIRRDTYDKIMALVYVPPSGMKRGAMLDATGARRRLQALARNGYTLAFLSGEIGWNKAFTGRFIGGKDGHRTVHYTTLLLIKATYAKYAYVDPVAELGHDKWACSRARQAAVRNGYAPAACWDDDTLDDPHAVAEWTGYCGKPRGYRIHRREGIPICQPCRDAHAAKRGRGFYQIDPERLTAAREAAGLSMAAMARLVGCDSAAPAHWERGRSQPRRDTLDALHDVLGLPDDYLIKDEEDES